MSAHEEREATTKPSGEIGLDELETGVNVDLPQGDLARVHKLMRRIRRDDDDTAGFHLSRFLPDRDAGATFNDESDLDVGMRMQRRACPGLALTM